MGHRTNSVKPLAKVAKAVLAGFGAAMLVGAVLLAGAPREAAATPVFAQQTGLPCGQCHVNPAGGGKLKTFGEKFKENGNKLPGK